MMSVFRLTEEQYAARLAKAKPTVESKVSLADIFTTPAPKKSKFGNVKTEVDGIKFDSKKEAKRWQELKLLEQAGEISQLERQIKYTLLAAQERDDGTKERGVTYVCDFQYWQHKPGTGSWMVVEDAKGMRTPDYVIKRKMLLFVHGITIKET